MILIKQMAGTESRDKKLSSSTLINAHLFILVTSSITMLSFKIQ